MLTLDAGVIVFQEIHDGDTFISGEIVVDDGPHPEADSDFALFCEILPEAARAALRSRPTARTP